MITETERRKICKAHAGDGTLPKIAKIAWGDGGVDDDGQPKAVTGKEVGLYNELLKKGCGIPLLSQRGGDNLQVCRDHRDRRTDRKEHI